MITFGTHAGEKCVGKAAERCGPHNKRQKKGSHLYVLYVSPKTRTCTEYFCNRLFSLYDIIMINDQNDNDQELYCRNDNNNEMDVDRRVTLCAGSWSSAAIFPNIRTANGLSLSNHVSDVTGLKGLLVT